MTLHHEQDDEYSIHISAIMSGLMVVFLFIAITYIHSVKLENDDAKDIVENFEKIKEEIIESIKFEFLNEMGMWNALVDPSTLSFQFNSPDVLFKKGSSDLTPEFKSILNDFFPRYLKILKNLKFREYIYAIQIEGHTSSEWDSKTTGLTAYIKNMELSQLRSAKVLEFVLKIEDIGDTDIWTRNKITSIGYSSSQLKYIEIDPRVVEDKITSRRVVFRIVTDAELRLDQISKPDSNI